MEKLIYLLWRPADVDAQPWAERLLRSAPTLSPLLRSLRFNVQDADVAAASALRRASSASPPDAVAQVWVDSAIESRRAPLDAALRAHCARIAAYLVTESQPLVNQSRPPQRGQRTTGFAQMALLKRPARLDVAQWLSIWHGHHTAVAIETQSTFEYIQNVVARRLTPDAPDYDAFVEECFPAAAMTDPLVFFDAGGSQQRFQQNLDRMMDSVHRFIDMDQLDVLPTSQYCC